MRESVPSCRSETRSYSRAAPCVPRAWFSRSGVGRGSGVDIGQDVRAGGGGRRSFRWFGRSVIVERFSHRRFQGRTSPTRPRVDFTFHTSPKRQRVFRGESTRVRVLMLRYSVPAPKGTKQESPGQRPGKLVHTRILVALKGHNMVLDQTRVVPFQGVVQLPNSVLRAMPWALLLPPRSGRKAKQRNIKTYTSGS